MKDFIKYPKIRILGHKENKGILNQNDFITIQEKIDGGNFRFMLYQGKLIFGSRETNLGDENILTSNAKQFERCINFIKEHINREYLKRFTKSYIFFGENCIKHTVNYNWIEIPPFLGFDIYSLEFKKFLDVTSVFDIFTSLHLPFVPIICNGGYYKYSEVFNIIHQKEFPSIYSLDGKAEGIVIKNYQRQLFAKIVDERFKEKNKEVFGYTKKYSKNDNEKFIAKYCTNARIEKHIFKLIDDGFDLSMELMKHLPLWVYKDIWNEEFEEIVLSHMILDFGKIRNLIAKRCVNVLQQIIINSELNR